TQTTLEKLKEIPPTGIVLNSPSSVPEEGTLTFSADVFHWSELYTPAYEWVLNGNVISKTRTGSYSTSKNSQGQYNLEVSVGNDNGSGDLDETLPVRVKSQSFVVADTYPAILPEMTLFGVAQRNSLTGQVQINTGDLQEHCETFSFLALTE